MFSWCKVSKLKCYFEMKTDALVCLEGLEMLVFWAP